MFTCSNEKMSFVSFLARPLHSMKLPDELRRIPGRQGPAMPLDEDFCLSPCDAGRWHCRARGEWPLHSLPMPGFTIET